MKEIMRVTKKLTPEYQEDAIVRVKIREQLNSKKDVTSNNKKEHIVHEKESPAAVPQSTRNNA